MHKKLIALLAILVMMVPAAFADTTVDLVGGLAGTTGNSIGIGFGTDNFGYGNFMFSLSLDAEADILFHENHGMYVNAGFNLTTGRTTTVGYAASIGYVYKTYFENFDLLVTAGPHISGIGNMGTFGLAGNVYLDFYFSKNVFMRAGAGVGMNFLSFGPNNTRGGFWMEIRGPYLGVGYSF